MPDLNGTIMEISGLGQEAEKKDYSWLLGVLGVGIVGCIVITSCFLRKRKSSGLGIIKECRSSDRVSGRRASSQKWCLWDSKGKRVIGRHSSRSKALRQENAIHARRGR